MGLKLNGSYISLILAVQIGKWTAKFRVKLCAPQPGWCMQERNVGITCAGGRGAGRRRRRDPAPRAPFAVAASRSGTLSKAGESAGKGAGF